jgi:dolichol-phosphate mannosyltransferase
MDADGTHTPSLIIPMVRMIGERCDVVSASRFQPGARMVGVPLFRRFTGLVGSLLFRLLFPTSGVKEYTSGYRAYHVAALHKAMQHYGNLFIEEEDFECMADVLLKLRRMPVTFGEVPTIIRYDLKEGGTKMKVGRTILGTLLIMLKRRLSL